MSAPTFEEAVHELALALSGINATRYLSAAGIVVLLYDHILLLNQEIRIIWAAQWSLSKAMFLINRYLVPACLLINAHMLSGLSAAGLSTTTWLPISAFLGITSLAVANIFVVQRVWALWSRNNTIKNVLIGAFILLYIATYTTSAVAFARLIPFLAFSAPAKTCIVLSKPTILIVMYAVPVTLDVMIFSLTCWNAFDRPRHMETAITKQLVTDGVVYFVCLMSLRLFNILIIAIGDTSYSQLGVYFLWAMITVLINRMLITSGIVEVHAGPDPSGRQTPFRMPERSMYVDYEDEDEDGEAEDAYTYPCFFELDRKPSRSLVV